MSGLLLNQSRALLHDRQIPPSSLNDGDGGTLIEMLLASGQLDRDHVLIFGSQTLGPLLALSRLPCRSVTALHPDRCLPALAPADVLWVTADARFSRMIAPLLGLLPGLRSVVVETPPAPGLDHQTSALLDLLRLEGFVQVGYAGSGLIAARPSWLRRIV